MSFSEKSGEKSSESSPERASDTSQSSLNDRSQSPKYMGLTGRKLRLAVSVVATTGFLLFGYDRKLLCLPFFAAGLTLGRGRDVWHHFRRPFQ